MPYRKVSLTLGDLGDYFAALATMMYQPQPVIPTNSKFKRCFTKAFERYLNELLAHFELDSIIVSVDETGVSPLLDEMFQSMKRKRIATAHVDFLQIQMSIESAQRYLKSFEGTPVAGNLLAQILKEAMEEYLA